MDWLPPPLQENRKAVSGSCLGSVEARHRTRDEIARAQPFRSRLLSSRVILTDGDSVFDDHASASTCAMITAALTDVPRAGPSAENGRIGRSSPKQHGTVTFSAPAGEARTGCGSFPRHGGNGAACTERGCLGERRARSTSGPSVAARRRERGEQCPLPSPGRFSPECSAEHSAAVPVTPWCVPEDFRNGQ